MVGGMGKRKRGKQCSQKKQCSQTEISEKRYVPFPEQAEHVKQQTSSQNFPAGR